MVCITLIPHLVSVNTTSSLWHTIIRDFRMQSLGLSASCWLPSFSEPLMLPPNGSNMFGCTTFILPSPTTGAILKTGNPAYGCPSMWYMVSSQWCWILGLPLKAVLLRRTMSPTPNRMHLILWLWFHLCLLFSFSMICWAVLHAYFTLPHNCCTNLVLVVAYMSVFWVPNTDQLEVRVSGHTSNSMG